MEQEEVPDLSKYVIAGVSHLLSVAAEETLVNIGDPGFSEIRVRSTVEVPFLRSSMCLKPRNNLKEIGNLCAGLPTGGVRKGLQGLVCVDQVLVTRLWSVLAPCLT